MTREELIQAAQAGSMKAAIDLYVLDHPGASNVKAKLVRDYLAEILAPPKSADDQTAQVDPQTPQDVLTLDALRVDLLTVEVIRGLRAGDLALGKDMRELPPEELADAVDDILCGITKLVVNGYNPLRLCQETIAEEPLSGQTLMDDIAATL